VKLSGLPHMLCDIYTSVQMQVH